MKQEEIIKKLRELYAKLDEKNKWWYENGGVEKSYEEYLAYLEPEQSKADALDLEYRMLLEPEYSELPSYGNVIRLEEFIEICETGGFIDYDGSGEYVKDGKKSNITVLPSDIKAGKIRKEFDSVIWFNR